MLSGVFTRNPAINSSDRQRTAKSQEECTGEAGSGIECLARSRADQALVESRRYVTLRLDLRLSTVPVWFAVMWSADSELWWCCRCSALLPRPRLPPALAVLIGRLPPPVLFLGTTSSWLLRTHTHHSFFMHAFLRTRVLDRLICTYLDHGHTHTCKHALQRTALKVFFFPQ